MDFTRGAELKVFYNSENDVVVPTLPSLFFYTGHEQVAD